MIGIPEYARPSNLLWCDQLSPAAVMLREECNALTAATPARSLEALIRDAGYLCDRDAQQCCALVLVHLADRCRELGKLGPALKCAERAEELFCTWPKAVQVHNHAVTLYLLGLVHQLLGLDREALENYHRAHGRFTEAEAHWAANGRDDQQIDCRNAKSWIEKLSEYVARARIQGGRTALHCSVLIGFGPADFLLEENELPVVQAAAESLVVRLHMHQAQKVYALEPAVQGQKGITIEPDQEYFLEVVGHVDQASVKFPGADYLLLQREREFTFHDEQDIDHVRYIADEDYQDPVGLFKEVA